MSDVARSAAGAVRRTVLTVVADPVIRELLALHLREAGFFAVTAATSAEACRLAGEVLPDVLLIDPDAPECADLAFCARLSETVRIVVLSGSPACCSRGSRRCSSPRRRGCAGDCGDASSSGRGRRRSPPG